MPEILTDAYLLFTFVFKQALNGMSDFIYALFLYFETVSIAISPYV